MKPLRFCSVHSCGHIDCGPNLDLHPPGEIQYACKSCDEQIMTIYGAAAYECRRMWSADV